MTTSPIGETFSRSYIDAALPVVDPSLLPWLLKDRREAEEGSYLIIRNPIAFAQVISPPQWLHVAPVKAFALFLGVRQIKRRTGDDVIDVPSLLTVVGPVHAGKPEGLKVSSKLSKTASQEHHSRCAFPFPLQHVANTHPRRLSYRIARVFLSPFTLVGTLFDQCGLRASTFTISSQFPFSMLWVAMIALLASSVDRVTALFDTSSLSFSRFWFGSTDPSQFLGAFLTSFSFIKGIKGLVRLASATVAMAVRRGWIAIRHGHIEIHRHVSLLSPIASVEAYLIVQQSITSLVQQECAVRFWEGKCYLLDRVIANARKGLL